MLTIKLTASTTSDFCFLGMCTFFGDMTRVDPADAAAVSVVMVAFVSTLVIEVELP